MSNKQLFRKESIDTISSPEQLDQYIRVIKPSVWIILAAILLFFVALFAWGVTGIVRNTQKAFGIQSGTDIVCYLMPRDAVKVQEGMPVELDDGVKGVVTTVDYMPLKKEEVAAQLNSEYYASLLPLTDWNIRVEIDSAQDAGQESLANVTIVLDEFKPIEFLFG